MNAHIRLFLHHLNQKLKFTCRLCKNNRNTTWNLQLEYVKNIPTRAHGQTVMSLVLYMSQEIFLGPDLRGFSPFKRIISFYLKDRIIDRRDRERSFIKWFIPQMGAMARAEQSQNWEQGASYWSPMWSQGIMWKANSMTAKCVFQNTCITHKWWSWIWIQSQTPDRFVMMWGKENTSPLSQEWMAFGPVWMSTIKSKS